MQGVLAGAIQSDGSAWSDRLLADCPIPPFVLRAGARDDGPGSAVIGERTEQPQTRLDPEQILWCRPEQPRLGVPREMQQMGGRDMLHELGGGSVGEEVRLVPAHGVRGRWWFRPGRHGVNLHAPCDERSERPAADEARGPGDEHPAHAATSG